MAKPPYKPGDLVNLSRDFANQVRVGPFEVLRKMPVHDNAEDQYRVRGPDGLERAVGQNEITDGAKVPPAAS